MADFSPNSEPPFETASSVSFDVDADDAITRFQDNTLFRREGDQACFARKTVDRDCIKGGADTYLFRQFDGSHIERPYAPR